MEENLTGAVVEATGFFGQLGMYTPWIIGIVAAVVVTQFLIQLGKWEHSIPWQIRAFTRVLIMIIFIYLLQLGAIAFLPEALADRVKIFADGLGIIGDIIKFVIGSVVGALSSSIKDSFNIPVQPTPPTEEESK